MAPSVCTFVCWIPCIAAIAACHTGSLRAEDAAALSGLVRIEVEPPRIVLASARAQVQLVVTGYFADGDSRDVTHLAKLQADDPSIAKSVESCVMPLRAGETTMRVIVGTQTAVVPVSVSGVEQPDPVRFRSEVLAVFTKHGCNAGSCHGSPEGKGGFPLSLLAYAPDKDAEAVVFGGLARRVEPIEPQASLLLRKPLLRVPHVGGKRLHPTDLGYRVLHDWIAEGVNADVKSEPECTGITVFPLSRVLRLPDDRQQLRVVATYANGASRDVTRLATYSSSNQELATCQAGGVVRGVQRGVVAVSVRYLDYVQSVFFTVVEDVEGFRRTDDEPDSEFDRLVNEKLNVLQILPSELCDDATFVRRLSLDLTGLLPEPDIARAFIADASPSKRSALIDQLLATDECARFWALKDADLLRINSDKLKDGRAELFAEWLFESWRRDQPFDEFVRELLTAAGDTTRNAPANFFLAIPNLDETAETTAQLFMGSRINCAKCHNHPFENWTQSDYYRIVAVFARTKNEKGTIVISPTGKATHPATGEVMRPWGAEKAATEPADRRIAFAQWLTAPGNPFLARVAVNRIWAHLLGRGIVHPVDDFRSSNPPANPELLDALASEFERSGYSRRHVVRLICNTQAYQRSAATNRFNADDVTQFSHHIPRRLSAEQIGDATGYATRALPPARTVPALRAEADAQLAALLQRLPEERPAWEAAVAEKLAATACWLAAWRRVGGFGAKTFEDAVATGFPPEIEPDFTYQKSYNDGKLKWQAKPEWVDGQIHLTLDSGVGPFFLARKIYANHAGKAVLSFGSNGSLKVWVNGNVVLDNPERRAVTPGEDRVEVALAAGENTLLLKIANGGGFFSFYFRMLSFDGRPPARFETPKSTVDLARLGFTVDVPVDGDGLAAAKLDVPVEVAELVAIPAAGRTEAQQATLAGLFESTHLVLQPLRSRVERLKDRLDYHTQRPFPEQSPFLQAFGQPKRESPCACERSNEPTIALALQLLNGDLVRNRTIEGAATYTQFGDDRTLVENMYWSTFSRAPTTREAATAVAYLERHSDRPAAAQDLLWALLNTQEFLFQH